MSEQTVEKTGSYFKLGQRLTCGICLSYLSYVSPSLPKSFYSFKYFIKKKKHGH